MSKICTWDYVEYFFKGKETDSEIEKNNITMAKINISCNSENEAISNFCYWLNNGALNSMFYAKKDGGEIEVYEHSFQDDVSDKPVNKFFGFKFYDTSKKYRGKYCPAFTDINMNEIEKGGDKDELFKG